MTLHLHIAADASSHFPGEPQGFNPDALFPSECGEQIAMLQHLLVALTSLQKVEDKDFLDKLAEVRRKVGSMCHKVENGTRRHCW